MLYFPAAVTEDQLVLSIIILIHIRHLTFSRISYDWIYFFFCLLFKCDIKCGVAWRVSNWWLKTSLHSFITKHWGFFAFFDFSTLKTITVLLIIKDPNYDLSEGEWSSSIFQRKNNFQTINQETNILEQKFKNYDISSYMKWTSTWGSIGYMQPRMTATRIIMYNSLYKWLPSSSLGRKMGHTCTDRYAQSTSKCYLGVTSMEIP